MQMNSCLFFLSYLLCLILGLLLLVRQVCSEGTGVMRVVAAHRAHYRACQTPGANLWIAPLRKNTPPLEASCED